MVTNTSANTPTGTSGTVLQGQGAGTALALSTATYPATTTINQLLYSSSANTVGGLATANQAVLTTGGTGVPVLTPLATNGQLLIGSTAGVPAAATITAGAGITVTNAANAITITANGSTPDPSTTVTIYDDFVLASLSSGAGSELLSSYPWGRRSTSNCSVSSTTTNPGLYLSAASSSGNSLYREPGILIGGGVASLTWYMKTNTLSSANPRFTWRLGFIDASSCSFPANPVNGIYFQYSDNVNSGNWQICAANSSTRTNTNTSTAADTNYHKFLITVNAGGTSAEFFIDGVSLGTVSTNLPATYVGIGMMEQRTTGTGQHDMTVDYVYMIQTLTAAR